MGYQDCEERREGRDYLLGGNDAKDMPYLRDNEGGEDNRGEGKKFAFGVALALAANLLFTANNFIMKSLQVNVSDAVLVRCVLQILILTSYIYKKGESLLPESRGARALTLLQGVSGAVCLIMSLASVRAIPVVEALAIIYFCPVVTMGLASLILGDQLNLAKIFSGLVLIIGELLVCQPPFLFPPESSSTPEDKRYYVLGVVMALATCISGSFNAIFVNMLKTKPVSVAVLLDWVAFSVIVLAVGYSSIVGDSHILSASITSILFTDWLVLIGLAFAGTLGFLCVTLSLQLISPSLMSSIRSLELVFAAVVTSFILQQLPTLVTSLGVILVTSGVLVLTFDQEICRKLRITNEECRHFLRSCISCKEQTYESIP
eukprot:TRINITY_DN66976_c0_g1_i1.p1 TRINITY_DN66976_c0_g1~~TRINITY_DN66976_c0_g1_i1.p1  ORF type:complete len:375 (+),score=45.76 TRINITY_DN66976_c0_g1_i1:70-1194(+)